MDTRPTSAADERDEPFYIDTACPDCGEKLVLFDEFREYDDDIWYDEWVCPSCDNGIYFDWPEEAKDRLDGYSRPSGRDPPQEL